MQSYQVFELLKVLDYSNPQSFNTEELMREFNLDYDYQLDLEDFGFKTHSIANWCCTDSHVGYNALTYNGEPFAVTFQSSRKSDVQYFFVSQEKAKELFNVILGLMKRSVCPDVSVLTEKNKLDDGRGIEVDFSGQLIDKFVYHVNADEMVEVVKTYDSYEEIKLWRNVSIKFADGNVVTVEMADILVPYKIKNNDTVNG